jgi:hypothetical protein
VSELAQKFRSSHLVGVFVGKGAWGNFPNNKKSINIRGTQRADRIIHKTHFSSVVYILIFLSVPLGNKALFFLLVSLLSLLSISCCYASSRDPRVGLDLFCIGEIVEGRQTLSNREKDHNEKRPKWKKDMNKSQN